MIRPLLELRQAALLGFVRDLVRTHGTFPSPELISERVGIFSTIGLECRLRTLERRGLIVRPKVHPRAAMLSTA